MVDIQFTKIPVFTDVNDAPILPTATSAGNGSHLINQHNSLVQETETYLGDLQDSINIVAAKTIDAWKVVSSDYDIKPGEKVFIKNHQPGTKTVYYLYVPTAPTIGTTFSYISANSSVDVDLKLNANLYMYINNEPTNRVHSRDEFVKRTFIYLGNGFEWKQIEGLPVTIAYNLDG